MWKKSFYSAAANVAKWRAIWRQLRHFWSGETETWPKQKKCLWGLVHESSFTFVGAFWMLYKFMSAGLICLEDHSLIKNQFTQARRQISKPAHKAPHIRSSWQWRLSIVRLNSGIIATAAADPQSSTGLFTQRAPRAKSQEQELQGCKWERGRNCWLKLRYATTAHMREEGRKYVAQAESSVSEFRSRESLWINS